MDLECPLCNAFIDVKEYCPQCGIKLEDWGRVEDFFEPYNPYLDIDIVAMGEGPHRCVHLFKCPECSYDTRITVNHMQV